MAIMVLNKMTGETIGIVILKNLWKAFAPSIAAASYSSSGRLCKLARKMIIVLPNAVKRIKTNDGITQVELVNHPGPLTPNIE